MNDRLKKIQDHRERIHKSEKKRDQEKNRLRHQEIRNGKQGDTQKLKDQENYIHRSKDSVALGFQKKLEYDQGISLEVDQVNNDFTSPPDETPQYILAPSPYQVPSPQTCHETDLKSQVFRTSSLGPKITLSSLEKDLAQEIEEELSKEMEEELSKKVKEGLSSEEENEEYLESLAKQGDRSAQDQLFHKFYAKNDQEKMYYWASHLAEQGESKFQYITGAMLWNGEGTSQDRQEAAQWFLKAAKNGYQAAFEKLKGIYHPNPSQSLQSEQEKKVLEQKIDLLQEEKLQQKNLFQKKEQVLEKRKQVLEKKKQAWEEEEKSSGQRIDQLENQLAQLLKQNQDKEDLLRRAFEEMQQWKEEGQHWKEERQKLKEEVQNLKEQMQKYSLFRIRVDERKSKR